MGDRLQRMLEAQRKREEAMREKELKKKEEQKKASETKENNSTKVDITTLSKAQQERIQQELQYEKQELARRKEAEERLRRENEEISKREEQRREMDSKGILCEVDWKNQQDQDRRRREIEQEKRRREIDRAASEQMRQAHAISEAKRETRPDTTVSVSSPLVSVKEIPCIWGCKCPGFESAGVSRSGPELCKHCQHAKSMHHL